MKSNPKAHDAQIALIVHGFMQVWNKYEATLSRELAQIQDRLGGMQQGRNAHPDANYELFYRVSSNIHGRDSLTMGELSSALSVPLSTATRMVDWLVDNGYVQRLPDPDDRRVVRVALTEAGKEVHQTIDSYVKARIQNIISCLSDEECTTLLSLFGKVVSSLREEAQ